MKLSYYAETDSLYIELLPSSSTDVIVINDDVRIDVNEMGRAIGIDIDNANKYYDVMNLETSGIYAVRTTQPANA
jgi:uncharacterized protein YuzE